MALTLNYGRLNMFSKNRNGKRSGTVIKRTYNGHGLVSEIVVKRTVNRKATKVNGRNKWEVESVTEEREIHNI